MDGAFSVRDPVLRVGKLNLKLSTCFQIIYECYGLTMGDYDDLPLGAFFDKYHFVNPRPLLFFTHCSMPKAVAVINSPTDVRLLTE